MPDTEFRWSEAEPTGWWELRPVADERPGVGLTMWVEFEVEHIATGTSQKVKVHEYKIGFRDMPRPFLVSPPIMAG